MGMSPFDPALFLFCNAERRILKSLYWDRTGFCLWISRRVTSAISGGPLGSTRETAISSVPSFSLGVAPDRPSFPMIAAASAPPIPPNGPGIPEGLSPASGSDPSYACRLDRTPVSVMTEKQPSKSAARAANTSMAISPLRSTTPRCCCLLRNTSSPKPLSPVRRTEDSRFA